MTHPHSPPESTPQDGPFLRTFFVSLGLLLSATAASVLLIDPLGQFGTGLIPPVVSADRDQKAALYRGRVPAPQVVVLGSSRSKTIAPGCLEQLDGRPAFNLAVNGAGTEDLVAILRFLLKTPGRRVETVFVGVDPEMMQGGDGVLRGLQTSRTLGRFAPGGASAGSRVALGAELFGWQVVSAAIRSVARRVGDHDSLPEFVLEPDGLQRYPRVEAALRMGTFPQHARVLGSIPGILGRYERFSALEPERVGYLKQFALEAKAAGVNLVAFIPPVHPAFMRAAAGTAWRERTEETVRLLRSLEGEGLLRYVETRPLLTATADTVHFVDAIHFLAPAAATLAVALTGSPGRCAVQ
jgi:hypothetical protein